MQKQKVTRSNSIYATSDEVVDEGKGTILDLTDELLAEIDEALGGDIEFAAQFMHAFKQRGGE